LEQPWFLNTVIEIETSLSPDDLMRACLAIEADCGRQREQSNGPRTLDIDIILSEDRIVDLEGIIIPHPRYAERRFVVEPLAELAPDFVDPVRHQSSREILEQLRDESEVRRVGPPLI
jgi:2-amino-4-hydroxy-6-hydroxymethyldihydropteridine diphosphokinase